MKLYAIGGVIQTGLFPQLHNENWEYNTLTNSWFQKSPCPEAAEDMAAATVGCTLYVVNGGKIAPSYLNRVWAYDPATDTWSSRAAVPVGCQAAAACAIGDKIYVVGGVTGDPQTAIPDLHIYNVGTNVWSSGASMLGPRAFLAVAAVGGTVYAFGGDKVDHIGPFGNPGPSGAIRIVEAYDPDTNTWTRKADLPNAVESAGAVAIGGTIYVVGGGTSAACASALSFVQVYDPATDTWVSDTDLPSPETAGGVAAVGGAIYVAGGCIYSPPVIDLSTLMRSKIWPDLIEPMLTWSVSPTEVCSGHSFRVDLEVTNGPIRADDVAVTLPIPGGAGSATLLSGPSRTSPFALEPEESVVISWTYTGSSPSDVILTATITGLGSACGNPKSMMIAKVPFLTPGAPQVLLGLLSQVAVGQWFYVSITVGNTGQSDVLNIYPYISASPPGMVTLMDGPTPASVPSLGGLTTTFVWTYSANGRGLVCFEAGAEGTTCGDTQVKGSGAACATILEPARIVGNLTVSATDVCAGIPFLLMLTVSNTGDDQAGVTATPALSLATALPTLVGPTPSFSGTIPPRSAQVYSWTVTGTKAGGIRFGFTVTGSDAFLGTLIDTGFLQSPVVLVRAPGKLVATLTVPHYVSAGHAFTATLYISNTGYSDVTNVTPSLTSPCGVLTGASPPGPLVITPGGTTLFAFTSSPFFSGPCNYYASVMNGKTLCTASAISATASASTTVQVPATIVATINAATPPPVCDGEPYLVVVEVWNQGEASATGFGVAAFTSSSVGPVGGVYTQNGPWPPLPVVLAGGTRQSFTWTLTGFGMVRLSATVTARDANSGAVLAVRKTTIQPVVVQPAGKLVSFLLAPSMVCSGQKKTVSLTVSNTGGVAVTSVTPSISASPSSLIGWLSAPSPPIWPSIPAGGVRTFQWTYSAVGSGVVEFSASAAGSTCKGSYSATTATIYVPVEPPTKLDASFSFVPPRVCVGQSFLVLLTVSNTGTHSARIQTLALPLRQSGAGLAMRLAGPTPAISVVILGGTSRTFTFTYTGSTTGPVLFSTTMSGTDLGCTLFLSPKLVTSGTFFVTSPGALSGVLSAPPVVSIGQWFDVTMTVTNVGSADVLNVMPAITGAPAIVTLEAGPTPASVSPLASGLSQTFEWTYSATGTGVVLWSATAVGLTCGSTTILVASTLSTTVQSSSTLPVAMLVSTTTLCPGGTSMMFTAIDSGFDHTNGNLADAVVMGSLVNGLAAVGQFGMIYDAATDQWNCFDGMPVPAGVGCSYAVIYTSGISVVAKGETWVAGHASCPVATDDYVWRLTPPNPPNPATWWSPMQGVTPGTWHVLWTAMEGIAMNRGVAGPRTGWAGVAPGIAFFDGTQWSDPAIILGMPGGGMEVMNKISFPYGDSTNGWGVTMGWYLAYLDATLPPGNWVEPDRVAQFQIGDFLGVHVNAGDDIWLCGVTQVDVPLIAHTSSSSVLPIPVTSLPSPPLPEGDPGYGPRFNDITFYELDPTYSKGIAVGGRWWFDSVGSPGVGPLVCVTTNHGVDWNYVPVAVPPNYAYVELRAVRFVSPNTAYAVGFANDSSNGYLPIPFMVKIVL